MKIKIVVGLFVFSLIIAQNIGCGKNDERGESRNSENQKKYAYEKEEEESEEKPKFTKVAQVDEEPTESINKDTVNSDEIIVSEGVQESVDKSGTKVTDKKSAFLNLEQQAELKEALEEIRYYEEFNHKSYDFGELLFSLIAYNAKTLINHYAIPIEYLYIEEQKDPMGMWDEKLGYQKVDKVLMDEYIEKYFHVKPYQDGRQIIYQDNDVIYVYEKDGYYYWNMDPICLNGRILQIELIELVEKGQYRVIYDVFEENILESVRDNETIYNYIRTQEAVLGVVSEKGQPEWSYYSINNLGTFSDREGTEYLEINPLQVNEGEWITVEGTLSNGKASYADGTSYSAPVLYLQNPIRILDAMGKPVEINEIGIAGNEYGVPPIDDTMYGTKVIFAGRQMTGHTQYHWREMMLTDSYLYKLVY